MMNKETLKQISKYKILGVIIGIIWYLQSFNLCVGNGGATICSVPIFGYLVKLPAILVSPFLGQCIHDCFHYVLLIPLYGIIFVIIFATLFDRLCKRYSYFITIPTIVYFLYMYLLIDLFSYFIFENRILHTIIAIIVPLIFSYIYYLYLKRKMGLFKVVVFSLFVFTSVLFLMEGYLARTINNPNLCDIAVGETKDHCYFNIAIDKTDFNLCSKITADNLRHNCWVTIAWRTKNASLCDEIMEEYSKNICKHNFPK